MRAYLLGFSLAALAYPAAAAVQLQCEGTVTVDGKAMASQIRLETGVDDGRVKLPAVLLPPVRNGGPANGWRPLRQVELTEDSLSARVALSIADQPELRLDRRAGRLEMVGFGDAAFEGDCAEAK